MERDETTVTTHLLEFPSREDTPQFSQTRKPVLEQNEQADHGEDFVLHLTVSVAGRMHGMHELRIFFRATIPPQTREIVMILVRNRSKLNQFVEREMHQPTIKQVDHQDSRCGADRLFPGIHLMLLPPGSHAVKMAKLSQKVGKDDTQSIQRNTA